MKRMSNHVWVYSAISVYCSKKCASLKAPEKSQNSAFSYTENKRHLSARIGLVVLLYGSKMHLGNGTEMELRSALSAFLRLHFFFVPFHLCLLSVPVSLCLFSGPFLPVPFFSAVPFFRLSAYPSPDFSVHLTPPQASVPWHQRTAPH